MLYFYKFPNKKWQSYQFNTILLVPVPTIHAKQHYDDVIMTTLASQITSLAIVFSIVYSDANKWPVTRKMFPFDDVIMKLGHNMLADVRTTLALGHHQAYAYYKVRFRLPRQKRTHKEKYQLFGFCEYFLLHSTISFAMFDWLSVIYITF